MERKEKIVLVDGTEIEIENGAVENCVQVVLPDLDGFKELYGKFTEENMEKYQVKNADGLTCAVLENKCLKNAMVEQKEKGFLVSFNLADVNMVNKRLSALETGQSELQAGQSEIKADLELQDGAIADLGEIVGGMMEGVSE